MSLFLFHKRFAPTEIPDRCMVIVLYYIALHCIALHCIALHCIALHCIALHCIALHCIAHVAVCRKDLSYMSLHTGRLIEKCNIKQTLTA